eukprot:2785801-Pyramimonas_sp.AAC.1
MAPKGVEWSCVLGIAMYKSSAVMLDARSLHIEALNTREIGSDNAAVRTVLAIVVGLPAGKLAMTFGYLPTENGVLQMTKTSSVSKTSVERIHGIFPAAYAECCTLVHYDNCVNPGAALDIQGVTGSAHSRISQCRKSSKPREGFARDMAKVEELANMPAQ